MEPTDENLRAFEEAHRRIPEAARDAALPEQVQASLGALDGKRVLHLLCGSGHATVEFVRRGATVTGLDPSEQALELARELGPSVLWVEGAPDAIPTELRRGRFDLVYAGWTLAALADIDAWAAGIEAALRPGGDLLVFDEHPAAMCVDAMMRWRGDYFAPEGWRLGQVVTALVRASLGVRALEEYPEQRGSRAEQRLPGQFLLHARKP